MHLSKDQSDGLKLMVEWFQKQSTQIFTLAGYAGVGKTTLIQAFTSQLNIDPVKNIVYLAYTGKACGVLKRMGNRNTMTLHSFLYDPVEEFDGRRKVLRFKLKKHVSPHIKLIVVDEASMVPGWILRDLQTLNIPIILIGDPEQLPPIEVRSPETKQTIAYDGMYHLHRPTHLLTQIHRQAEGNPIIHLSKLIREGNWSFNQGAYNDTNGIHRVSIVSGSVFWMDSRYSNDAFKACEQILVGSNSVRKRINQEMRRVRGYDVKSQYPVSGEKLIATKNNWKLPIIDEIGNVADYVTNGTIFYTTSGMYEGSYSNAMKTFKADLYHPEYNSMLSQVYLNSLPYQESTTRPPKRPFHVHQSIIESDFAYAITVHKAQGSQFKTVIVFDESDIFTSAKFKWLYTAVTRASDKLILVTDHIRGKS